MKKYVWLLVVLLVVSVASIGFAAKPVLRVGSDTTYAPFESVDKKGNFVGFDMDLIRMIGAEIGMDVQIKTINWDGIIPGLMNGNYDCLISAMTITKERGKQIDFSLPYFTIKQAILIRADNKAIKSETDLVGKSISVQSGTTGDLFATKIKGVSVKRFTDNPQAIQAVINKNVDASIMDDLAAYDAFRKTPGLKFVAIKNTEKEGYGIGIKKGNTALEEKINKAIQTLEQNGKLKALKAKYPELTY
jgi:polar amino acid transport system substrate-binding protein